MTKKLNTIRNIAKDRKWVSFLYDNHPYSLLHQSVAGMGEEEQPEWLLQDEMTFEMQGFASLEAAVQWLSEHMADITDILA
ncbi:DUF2552 family protein [Ectobacillus ponti]|uniref:YqkC family protein n=1 Tax=Ectobacillus ponti TaxID=2961894 RepID=A0AA41X609_9BACI|nr:DUF2552 family protein [Ectobacillus ponti]MCP8966975.1 YqkC family protein [Ectobacillus ponti]